MGERRQFWHQPRRKKGARERKLRDWWICHYFTPKTGSNCQSLQHGLFRRHSNSPHISTCSQAWGRMINSTPSQLCTNREITTVTDCCGWDSLSCQQPSGSYKCCDFFHPQIRCVSIPGPLEPAIRASCKHALLSKGLEGQSATKSYMFHIKKKNQTIY